jgi:hypothetical protein
MKYAKLGEERIEATPKAVAACPACGEAMVAKCGSVLAWHWSHRARTHCDRWWETETAWHRDWKNRFPVEWQEVVMFDEALTACHIADVRTPAGLVIEFQRSTITSEEVAARQAFYGRMIWVVDGCRGFADAVNFTNMRERVNADGLCGFMWYSRSALFLRWWVDKPVFVDFGEHGFWRILRFDPKTKRGVAGLADRDAFVALAGSGSTDFSQMGGPASR